MGLATKTGASEDDHDAALVSGPKSDIVTRQGTYTCPQHNQGPPEH
jgi:hypothetical protein